VSVGGGGCAFTLAPALVSSAVLWCSRPRCGCVLLSSSLRLVVVPHRRTLLCECVCAQNGAGWGRWGNLVCEGAVHAVRPWPCCVNVVGVGVASCRHLMERQDASAVACLHRMRRDGIDPNALSFTQLLSFVRDPALCADIAACMRVRLGLSPRFAAPTPTHPPTPPPRSLDVCVCVVCAPPLDSTAVDVTYKRVYFTLTLRQLLPPTPWRSHC
jgi:hypothetical protein